MLKHLYLEQTAFKIVYSKLIINVLFSDLLIANSGKKIALDLVYFMTRLDGNQTDAILLMRDKFCFMSIVHPLIVLFSFAFYVSLSRSSTTEVAMSRR